jgi:membrane-bound ClpP family serine protease
MSLKTEIKGKNDPLEHVDIKIGDIGKCVSRLAPMGKIKVNGEVIEAKSLDDFIDEGTEIRVLEVLQTNVIVEKLN